MNIQVDPDLVPLIRAVYTRDVVEKLGHLRPSERKELETALKAVDEEEARAVRLFAAGKITESIWDGMWREWQDRRRTLQINLEALQQKQSFHIRNLDAALTIVAKVDILYRKLERSEQKDLLRQMVERVVVDPEGTIIRLELLPPFSYLHHVTKRVQRNSGEAVVEGKQNANTMVGKCSDYVLSGEEGVAGAGNYEWMRPRVWVPQDGTPQASIDITANRLIPLDCIENDDSQDNPEKTIAFWPRNSQRLKRRYYEHRLSFLRMPASYFVDQNCTQNCAQLPQ